MAFSPHYLPDLVTAVFYCVLTAVAIRWSRRLGPRFSGRVRSCLLLALVIVLASTLLAIPGIAIYVNHLVVAWVRCAGLFLTLLLLYGFVLALAMERTGMFAPERRRALQFVTAAAVAAPAALASFAIIRRDDLTFREIPVPVRGLPGGLNGLRIAQITDIHLSPFLSEATLRRAIGMANETRPHITFVTGDLISSHGDPLDLCLACLKDLRADAGLFGCLGNHERYAEAEDYTERQGAAAGLRFLRHESVQLQFGGSSLNLAGVDYQRKSRPYLVGAESLVVPGSFNLLLSHNPDVFPAAARKGFDFTVAGHTHGGQVTLEMLHPSLNAARFSTPYVHGLYEKSGKQVYVSRGIGTIGVPARLGAPPEVVLLRLCAI